MLQKYFFLRENVVELLDAGVGSKKKNVFQFTKPVYSTYQEIEKSITDVMERKVLLPVLSLGFVVVVHPPRFE